MLTYEEKIRNKGKIQIVKRLIKLRISIIRELAESPRTYFKKHLIK